MVHYTGIFPAHLNHVHAVMQVLNQGRHKNIILGGFREACSSEGLHHSPLLI